MSPQPPHRDGAGLGRGPLTRWLPVFWQASPEPPAAAPLSVEPGTTPGRFTRRIALAANRLTLPAAALAIVWQVGEALVPVLMGLAIDRALRPGDPVQLVGWLAVLALDFLALSLAFRFASQLSARAQQLVEHRLRAALSRSALHPSEGGARRLDGSVVSTITSDVTRLASSVNLSVFPVGELAGIAFIGVALLLIHWPLGVAALVGAAAAVWLMGALSAPFARSTRAYQALLAKTVGRATDLVAGYRVIKGVRAESEATRRYRQASREALTGVRRSIGALGRYLAASNTVSGVFVAGVAGLAGWYAVRGEISIGQLIAAAGLAQALLLPLRLVTANAGTVWAAAVASGGRVLELLVESGSRGGALTDARPSSPSGAPALQLSVAGRDIRPAPGELLGVRGDDRTAARIVAALLDPGTGDDIRVSIDGVAAEAIDPRAYRSHVVVAPHEAKLFSGTIADNLDLPTAPPDLRGTALRAAACDDFVTATSDGLASEVGENGNRLSGGQRQRLALARAYASDAAILVLHDPTTAVDSVTEATIADRLPEIRRGRSTVLIASSATLLGACDRIVDLEPAPGDGRSDTNGERP